MTTATTAQSARTVNPIEVGWQFVPQYYTFVNKQPNRLHCFYTKNSTFSHGTEGEDGKPCYGQSEIHQKILALGYENCKVFIHSVDAQSSANNGIIIQVVGEMSNKGENWKKFVQTFFLAEQPNGYFVLNDIFRFLKEETAGDEEEEEEEEAEAEHVEETITVTAPEPPVVPVEVVPVSLEQAADSYEPEDPSVQTATSATIDREPTPAPHAEEAAAEPPTNGINGAHHSDKAESVIAAEEAAENAAAAEPEATPAPAPAPEPITTVQEPLPAPPVEPAPAPVKVPSPAPPIPVSAPTPPAPEKPAGPKTWATLAANNTKKWGSAIASDAKAASVNIPQTPSPQPSAPKNVAPRNRPDVGGADGGQSAAMQAALSVSTAQCFVKSVTENVDEQVMRNALTIRFGAVKELDIVRSKACAFLEFVTVDSARRAIAASLPQNQGGEGGIRLEGKPAGPNNLPPRIIVETRKERGERPAPRPRGGAPGGEGTGRGGMLVGGEGGGRGGGRGRGGGMRGGPRGGGAGGPK